MADAPSMVATLVPVIVGGLIGLAGGWLGPSLLEQHKEKTETKKRRAEKFEELVNAVYDFDHWLDQHRWLNAFGEKTESLGPSPMAKIEAIAAVYFPEFQEEIRELNNEGAALQLWAYEAGEKRLAGNTGAIREGFNEVYAPYLKKRDTLLDLLKTFARSEFR